MIVKNFQKKKKSDDNTFEYEIQIMISTSKNFGSKFRLNLLVIIEIFYNT